MLQLSLAMDRWVYGDLCRLPTSSCTLCSNTCSVYSQSKQQVAECLCHAHMSPDRLAEHCQQSVPGKVSCTGHQLTSEDLDSFLKEAVMLRTTLARSVAILICIACNNVTSCSGFAKYAYVQPASCGANKNSTCQEKQVTKVMNSGTNRT